MNLRPLLALPVLLTMAACSTPPEVTASSRDEAFRLCMADVEEAVERVKADRQLAKDKPHLFDDNRDDYYDNFRYTYLISDEWETVTILNAFCKPRPLKNKNYYSNLGYIEYLVQPTGKGLRVESEVQQVIVSYGYTWELENKR